MKKNESNNKKTKIGLLILILCVSIGYAILMTQLNINGMATIPGVSWDVHFENYQKLNTTNIEPTTEPSIPAGSKTTTISYAVAFTAPGDVYEFTVDAVNDGTIDAMIESISSKLNDVEIDSEHPLPAYLDYSVTYEDGTPLQVNQLLASNNYETYKVKIGFKDVNPSELPEEAQVLRLDLTVTYIQADDNAYPVNVDFETSSWSELVAAYKAGQTEELQAAMEAGTTRSVDLGSLGVHPVRIANLSNPAECAGNDFSESACGFVIEFADAITTRVMNSEATNVGGWPATEIKTYLNNDIFNALPADLSKVIKNTSVVSSHGPNESANFTSTDKLYLLSTKEVYGKEGTGNVINKDTAEVETRQLDYYKAQNVTTDSYSGAIKQRNGANSIWWLRSAYSSVSSMFFNVISTGGWDRGDSNNTGGVSPAFRIG